MSWCDFKTHHQADGVWYSPFPGHHATFPNPHIFTANALMYVEPMCPALHGYLRGPASRTCMQAHVALPPYL